MAKDHANEQSKPWRGSGLASDLLTGIANRRLMSECFRQADERSLADESNYALVVLKADHLRPISDTYGHEFSD